MEITPTKIRKIRHNYTQRLPLENLRKGYDPAKVFQAEKQKKASMKRILITLLLLGTLLSACKGLGQKTYTTEVYTFSYPAGWKSMAEISPDYQSGKNYYWLGVEEELTLTPMDKAGDPGLYFSMASSSDEFNGNVITFPNWSYAMLADSIRGRNRTPLEISGFNGYLHHYERFWEGSWYQFQDYWVEDGKLLYVLSFHAQDLRPYQKEIDGVVESFAFIQ